MIVPSLMSLVVIVLSLMSLVVIVPSRIVADVIVPEGIVNVPVTSKSPVFQDSVAKENVSAPCTPTFAQISNSLLELQVVGALDNTVDNFLNCAQYD